jgi:hypothetical protein
MENKNFYLVALDLARKAGKETQFKAYYDRLQLFFLATDESKERALIDNALIYCGIPSE